MVIIVSFLDTFTAVLSVFWTNFLVSFFFFVSTSYSDFNNDLPESGNSKTFKYFHSSRLFSSTVSLFLSEYANS